MGGGVLSVEGRSGVYNQTMGYSAIAIIAGAVRVRLESPAI